MDALSQQSVRPAISLVIPCCNEEKALPTIEAVLPSVVAKLAAYGPVETIFVDDGSTDGTWHAIRALAQRLPAVSVVRHPANYGLGAALRTGFAHARGEIIVTTDADGTYPLTEIPALLKRMTEDIAIVTASPYHPDGGVDGVPAWRLIFSRGASQCYRAILGKNGRTVHTYTSLFRAYRRNIIPYVMPHHQGFLAVTEVLVRAMMAGYAVEEYPTTLRARRYGQSKARVVRITLSHLAFIAGIVTHRVHVRVMTTSPTSSAITSGEAARG